MANPRWWSRSLAFSLILITILPLSLRAQSVQQRPRVRVTLLYLSNVRQFMPVDRGQRGGLARISTLRKQIMKDSPNTLLLFAGNTLSPSVESIKYKGQQMIDAWNAVGLDYATLGNHEFDFGPDVLLQRMKESKFQWLAANVIDGQGQPFGGLPPFVVREIGGARIGFFGLSWPEAMYTSSTGNIRILGACETAKKVVPQMRTAGAQAIVALSHLTMRENKELARCMPEINLIIGGAEFVLLQSFVEGRPIFELEADARNLGRIELTFSPDEANALVSMDWEAIPVNDRVEYDPQFAAVTEKYKDSLASYNEVIGRTSVSLDARTESNRTGETNIGNFITDTFRQATGADVALINGGSIRADTTYAPGPLSKHDVQAILPFSNEVVKVEVTGWTLRQALENGVSFSGSGAEPGRFPQVSGIRFLFDVLRPPGSRVRGILVNGQPLDERKTYTVATISYLVNGGDGYEMFRSARPLSKQAQVLVDYELLRKAIASVPAIAPQVDGRIRRLDIAP